MTLGVGQFCTKPGLIFVHEDHAEVIANETAKLVNESASGAMLNRGICDAYCGGLETLENNASVQQLAKATAGEGSNQAVAALFQTDIQTFLNSGELTNELFGPASILVTYKDDSDLIKALQSLEGQLTASIHGTDAELAKQDQLTKLMEDRAGRIVFNGFPTGVEVCASMVHGGPFPSTSDGRSTSVGTMAIYRFTRAVCWQDCPQSLLPDELKDGNPLGIQRSEV